MHIIQIKLYKPEQKNNSTLQNCNIPTQTLQAQWMINSNSSRSLIISSAPSRLTLPPGQSPRNTRTQFPLISSPTHRHQVPFLGSLSLHSSGLCPHCYSPIWCSQTLAWMIIKTTYLLLFSLPHSNEPFIQSCPLSEGQRWARHLA